ncbi:pyridoxal-phosphate dependent enzyme, partial [Clostridioides difficile]|uniref:pyridoxal-phosphate dependent enzyme n=2 Tax=Clostridioides difficile TaxID=1496 RepID=UPI002E8E2D19
LGGSYSMGRYLAQRLNTDISELGYDKLTSKEIKEKLGEITFFTATDGNHGRGVAWTANKLGQKSVVLMPKGSSEFRLNKIKEKVQMLV